MPASNSRRHATSCARAGLVVLALTASSFASAAPERREDARSLLRASVRFVTPSAGQVLYGATPIRASVVPPPGTVVRQVELQIDGDRFGSDAVPPYEWIWNAGESMASHSIRIVATFSDGTRADNAITTRGLNLSEHEVVEGSVLDFVSLLVSVLDKTGLPVRGLRQQDFNVKERGDKVGIKSFHSVEEEKSLPLSLTILIDHSGSMRIGEEEWRDACVKLLGVLRPIDQIRVSAFAERLGVLQDFTRDAVTLAESLRGLGEPQGLTHLYSSVYEAIRDMRDFPGRKAIFVLTDGQDTEFQELGGFQGNRHDAILGAIERLAVRSGVTIVTILTTPSSRGLLPMQALAMKSGGWWTYPTSDLATLMGRLAERLLGAYVIGYDSSYRGGPDRKRLIDVSLSREETGWRVFTTTGVFGRQTPTEALEDDLEAGSVAQRVRAVEEIADLRLDSAPGLLVKALEDPDPEVEAKALMALGRLRDAGAFDKAMRRLYASDPRVREAAYRAAVAYGRVSIPKLTRIAEREGRDRPAALRALGLLGDPSVVGVIAAAMDSESCEAREGAADGAGFLFDMAGGGFIEDPGEGSGEETGGALELLRRALDDQCVQAADAAALALGRLAHPAALPRLIAIATDTAETARRGEAILALATYLSPKMFRALEERLVSGTPTAPEARRTTAQIYGAAIRTVRWLATEDGLARLQDLDADDAKRVLVELEALAGTITTDPRWRDSIDRLLRDMQRTERKDAVPAPGGSE